MTVTNAKMGDTIKAQTTFERRNIMSIGEIILERRKELKMTQKELAERLNVTDKTVSRWECGINLPDVAMLKSIATVLDVNISYFYEDVAPKEINETEEYDYDMIRKFKIGAILPFALLFVALVIAIGIETYSWRINAPLELISNLHTIIKYALEVNILNQWATLGMVWMLAVAITVASIYLYLKNSISFTYFYKEKRFQTLYKNVHKRIKIPYIIVFCLTVFWLML